MAIPITKFFEKRLSAPLKNPMWSWGAIRNDGVVFLRVWQHENYKEGNRRYKRVTWHEKHVDREANYGYPERLEHIKLVRAGAPCYLVVCKAKDTNIIPRTIESFIDDVFVAGELKELDGDTWIEIKDRMSADDIKPNG